MITRRRVMSDAVRSEVGRKFGTGSERPIAAFSPPNCVLVECLRPHLAETTAGWRTFPKGLQNLVSEALEPWQLLRITRFSENGLDRLELLPGEFNVIALFAPVGIAIRFEANLPGCRLSRKGAPAREPFGELNRLVLREAWAGTQREDHVRHSAGEDTTMSARIPIASTEPSSAAAT
jgi:hypothetical protein